MIFKNKQFNFCLKNEHMAEKVIPWIRLMATLPEDPGLIFRNHMAAQNHL